MNIIIPMAGMGKRLRPHTITTPKPLIPIAGKPIVQRIVEDILATINEKVDEIAYIISPKFTEETVALLVEIAANFGAQGKIYYQEEALGTAHAILCARESLKGNVFIAFADTLFKADFKLDTTKDAIIWTQRVADPSAFGVVRLLPDGSISEFVEKPQTFVSNLAIIGIYYFKDGENLAKELQYLIDNKIMKKGEYQLPDAMENMKDKGMKFYTGQVEEWLDCGNKNAVIYSNERILEIKKNKEKLVSDTAQVENSAIVPPCYIGPNVVIKNSVVGPHVSLEAGTKIEHSIIMNSIIMEQTSVKNIRLENSILGKFVTYSEKPQELSLGDFSVLQ